MAPGASSHRRSRPSRSSELDLRLTKWLRDPEEPWNPSTIGYQKRTPVLLPDLKSLQTRPSEDRNRLPQPIQLDLTRTQLAYDSSVRAVGTFANLWETRIVPLLVRDLELISQDGYAVNVVRGQQPFRREINIMTGATVAQETQSTISRRIKECFSEDIEAETYIRFSRGQVALSSSISELDVMNWRWHAEPMMGDSAGIRDLSEGGTLSGLLQIGQKGYWLVNCHILGEKLPNSLIFHPRNDEERYSLVHPSVSDYEDFKKELSSCSFLLPAQHELGRLIAWSGPPFKTYREVSNDYRVVTDWAIFEANCLKVDSVRKINGDQITSLDGISQISCAVPGKEVCSAGRTSGYCRARICEVPAIVSGGKQYPFALPDGTSEMYESNGTRHVTREWFLEHFSDEDPQHWSMAGPGVFGDSGGPIVCAQSKTFYGQIWGRNKYTDENIQQNPPVTYFTSATDLIEDIAEKTKLGKPMLPTEASVWNSCHGSLQDSDSSHPTRSLARPRASEQKRLPKGIQSLLSSLQSPRSPSDMGNPIIQVAE